MQKFSSCNSSNTHYKGFVLRLMQQCPLMSVKNFWGLTDQSTKEEIVETNKLYCFNYFCNIPIHYTLCAVTQKISLTRFHVDLPYHFLLFICMYYYFPDSWRIWIVLVENILEKQEYSSVITWPPLLEFNWIPLLKFERP